jgi:excisionase family DNA binding protein
MNREIITVVQVADHLQISKKVVYQLVNAGKLPACKILNKWGFDKHSVKQWISDNQSTVQDNN